MEKNKQVIVPVSLQDNQKENRTVGNPLPQKVVAHLKSSQTELLIYEGIKPSTLRILLTEMSINENRLPLRSDVNDQSNTVDDRQDFIYEQTR